MQILLRYTPPADTTYLTHAGSQAGVGSQQRHTRRLPTALASVLRTQQRCHAGCAQPTNPHPPHSTRKAACRTPGRTATVAVVWRAEDGHDVLVMAPVEALHHQLVRPRLRCTDCALIPVPIMLACGPQPNCPALPVQESPSREQTSVLIQCRRPSRAPTTAPVYTLPLPTAI